MPLHVRTGGLLLPSTASGAVRVGGVSIPFGPGGPPPAEDSIWGPTVTAGSFTDGGGAGITTGTLFIPQVAGSVTHLRALGWNGPAGSTAQGALYELTDNTAGVQLVTTAVFSGESGVDLTSGQYGTVPLSAPVALTVGRPYVIAVWHSAGHYWATGGVFASAGITSPGGTLYAPATAEDIQYDTGIDGAINGRFKVDSPLGLPTDTFNGGGYYTDLVFVPD